MSSPSMMIRIRDLQLPVSLGVFSWELNVTRTITLHLDITLATDKAADASASDDLADTLDYAALETSVAALLMAKHYHLLEHLCSVVAAHVLSHPFAQSVRVEIVKEGALQNAPAVAMVHEASKND